MRHGKKFNHLGRKAAHRKAMLANMACSLIEHKRITTTLAKAKALRVYVEPLITKSKDDTTHSRRIVFSYLKQKEAITELFSDIATKVIDREGGYTRILKLSNRLGDNAQMAFIELVDYNDEYTAEKPKRKKARRAKKQSAEVQTASIVEEAVVVEETPINKEEVESNIKGAAEKAPVVEDVVEATPVVEDVVEATPVVEDVVEANPVVEDVIKKQPEEGEANDSEEKNEKGE